MKLLFLGDFFFDYNAFPPDFEAICRFVQDNAYSVILNLETSWGTQGKPVSKRGVHLRSSDLLIEALKKLNVVAVCLANNHAMDFGAESLQSLCEQLTQAGIIYVGAGKNLTEALRPVHLSGTHYWLQNFAWELEEAVRATSYSAGTAPLNRKLILSQTQRLKTDKPQSRIINIYHWGFEYNLLPMPLDIQFAHDSLDAGADLIIGHHPHVIQPQQTYRGKQIFYSLGNFYFGSRRSHFKKIFKHHTPQNACDFGIGVVLDTDKDSVTHLIALRYDKSCDCSVIKQVQPMELQDLTHTDWTSNRYYQEAKRQSVNFTPVLTTNSLSNYIKLKWLSLLYTAAKILGPLRKKGPFRLVAERMKNR